VEIERTYLLGSLPEGLPPGEEIRQGYLAIDGDVEVRVRARAGASTLTVKGGHGEVRTERELALDDDAFAALWPLTAGRRLAKTRHVVPLPDGLDAEIDVYGGELDGLRVVEVEFPSEAASAAFAAPDWFGSEVTDDRRYANQRLAAAVGPPADDGGP
jgi:adenylate cyclase